MLLWICSVLTQVRKSVFRSKAISKEIFINLAAPAALLSGPSTSEDGGLALPSLGTHSRKEKSAS